VNLPTVFRHLLVLLILAERAWADAMQLKAGMDKGDGAANRQRHHSVRRLAKAANWAGVLAAASSAKGDPRTTLEASAYADWLMGACLVERKQWGRALAKLGRAE
jgi:signal recognition particle subunit SRP68